MYICNPKQTSICEQPNRTSIRYEYVFIVLRNVNLKFLVYCEDDNDIGDDTIRKKGYKHNGVYILAHKKLHKLNYTKLSNSVLIGVGDGDGRKWNLE